MFIIESNKSPIAPVFEAQAITRDASAAAANNIKAYSAVACPSSLYLSERDDLLTEIDRDESMTEIDRGGLTTEIDLDGSMTDIRDGLLTDIRDGLLTDTRDGWIADIKALLSEIGDN